MMGRRDDGQSQFVYNFRLEDHVPTDHLVRKIDAVLDTSWVHGEFRIVRNCGFQLPASLSVG
ncbi:MAG: hypothetical protein OER56_14120 [Hyphomicrobiales bacterium]|nr:hypothetical protein [Hyphomicrobiales bacterium]